MAINGMEGAATDDEGIVRIEVAGDVPDVIDDMKTPPPDPEGGRDSSGAGMAVIRTRRAAPATPVAGSCPTAGQPAHARPVSGLAGLGGAGARQACPQAV